jgi:predicted nucleotidyltransferase
MISTEQRKFVDRAVDVLKQEPRICGIALRGSYITGNMDEYSDLDFMIVVESEHFKQMLDDRIAMAGKVGGLLSAFTGEHIGVPSLLICLYDEPLIHVDYHFRPLDEAGERVDLPAILYEKDGALTNAFKKSGSHEVKVDPQWFEDRFWIWVHYIASKIGRRELFEALDTISFLRTTVIGPLLLEKNGKIPMGIRRIERYAPEALPKLVDTIAVHDPVSCVFALKASIKLYIDLRQPYEGNLVLRTGARKKAVEYLDNIAAQCK